MPNKPLILIIIIVLFVISNNCAVRRGIIEQNSADSFSDKDLLKTVLDRNISSNGFYIKKAIVNYSDSITNVDFLISIKHNKEDQYLSIVRTLSGIELYRIFIDRSTFLINDRLNRKVLKGNESFLKNYSGLDFNKLIFIFGDLYFSERIVSDSEGCISGEKRFYDFSDHQKLDLTINCSLKKLTKLKLLDLEKATLVDLEYEKFKNIGLIPFPHEIKLGSNGRIFKINVDVSDVITPWDESIEFVEGKNYERVELK